MLFIPPSSPTWETPTSAYMSLISFLGVLNMCLLNVCINVFVLICEFVVVAWIYCVEKTGQNRYVSAGTRTD